MGNPTDPHHAHTFRFSLIVATVNRDAVLKRLLQSLALQTFRDFEVIVVDQNEKIVLAPMLAQQNWPFRILHVRTIRDGGASAARNLGWRQARGNALVFPDDDAWYPQDYLDRLNATLERTGAQIVTGRAADPDGRTINGRFDMHSGPISRANVFTTQIEWNMAVDALLIRMLGGYDANISLGGPSAWQGGEGYDLVLRALQLGATCYFDRDLIGHHQELPAHTPDAAMVRKGRIYARGLGFVLKKHSFGVASLAWWVSRSLVNLALAALVLRLDRMRYYGAQAIGRVEGWTGILWQGPWTLECNGHDPGPGQPIRQKPEPQEQQAI